MGLSSSQARLLHLTARMHQIEYKAAKLEAQKLQMANQSRRVYQEYQEALEATKIQYKSMNEDASITFRDATMDILQNGCVPGYKGESSKKQYFLQNMDGAIMITPEVAKHYGLEDSSAIQGMSLDTYLQSLGKTKTERKYMEVTGYETDYENILGVNPITNSQNGSYGISYTAIENNSPGIVAVTPTLKAGVTQKTTNGATQITSDTNKIEENGTYYISDAAGLKRLEELSKSSDSDVYNSTGVTIILAPQNSTNSIDMSGENWRGISNFKGAFYGNGVRIDNLGKNGGTATNGLFESVLAGGSVQDVILNNFNITNTNSINDAGAQGTGAIISKIKQNNGQGTPAVKVSNCTAIGEINTTGKWNGGIVGCAYYTKVEISNCKTDINMNLMNSGGAPNAAASCNGGILGHSHGTANISNCDSNGSINGGYYDGGIVGHSDSTSTTISNSNANVEIHPANGTTSNGSIIGCQDGATYTFTNVTYNPDINSGLNPLGANTGTQGGQDAYNFKKEIKVPSISTSNNYKGDFYSNIYAALYEYDDGAPISSDMERGISNYVKGLYNYGNGYFSIANVNEMLCKYLNNNGNCKDFIEKLKADVIASQNSSIISSTMDYLNTHSSANVYNSEGYSINIQTSPTGVTKPTVSKAEVTVPSRETIIAELKAIFKKAEIEIPDDQINAFIPSNNNYRLADINKFITEKYKNTTALQEAISARNSTIPVTYDSERYTVNVTSGEVDKSGIRYGKKPIEVEKTDYYWDTSDPEIATAMAMWALAQKGVIVVEQDQASNYLYLKNMLEVGEAVLTTFDPSKAAEAFVAIGGEDGMSLEALSEMSESEYNETMNIFNTSVSVETHLQEVADEKNLKKAEAKYEADMRRIDFKDRQYDRELAALEAERNATKNEMETLKTVAKDNVDRTFKLFS